MKEYIKQAYKELLKNGMTLRSCHGAHYIGAWFLSKHVACDVFYIKYGIFKDE